MESMYVKVGVASVCDPLWDEKIHRKQNNGQNLTEENNWERLRSFHSLSQGKNTV